MRRSNQDVVGNDDEESASFEDARGYQNDQDLDVIGDDTPSWLLAFAPSDDDDEEENDVYDRIIPGLKRPRGVSFDSAVEADERSSTSTKRPRGRGVSFDSKVRVQPIPHSGTLTPAQRLRMYSTLSELRRNSIRNSREYRYEGYSWRNATEETEMRRSTVTGRLVHPAHEESRKQHAWL